MNEKMNVTLPDNRVPIKVGDPSFIYEGVYHPIIWLGQMPYRPRVEMLLVKDGRFVFLQKLENNRSGENEGYSYRIPGGSIDPDSTKMQQAINETMEEGRKGVKSAMDPGVQYYEQYKPGFLETHHFPIEYVGTINDVFVGEFDGKDIPKEQIEEKDRDEDMATKGKFHAISLASQYLRPEHLRALIASGKLDTVVETLCKTALNRVKGYDAIQVSHPSFQSIHTMTMESMDPEMIPGGRLYHGTDMKIDVFHPMSLDLGNIHQEPGWSTFCFDNRLMALRFGLMRVLQRVTKGLEQTRSKKDWISLDVKWSIRYGKPYCNERNLNPHLFNGEPIYVYTFDASRLKDIGIGNDSKLQEYTFRDDNVIPDTVEIITIDRSLLREHLFLCKSEDDFQKMVQDEEALIDEYSRGAYAAMLNRDYNANSDVGKIKWAIKQGELNPGDDVVAFIREKGYDLFEIGYITGFNLENEKKDLDDLLVEESVGSHTVSLTSELISELKKKYPLPMLKHLRTPDATNKGYALFGPDNDLIGIIMYDRSSSYVTALEVVPKYQSSGYGNQLLQMAIHDGIKKITATNSNKVAIKLYEKTGFRSIQSEHGRTTMIFEGKALTKKQRENIPLKDYGLPDSRKYPMPDKKHVRAAIRFFNYVDKKDEKTLAKNINRKIKEYGMESEIKVGEDNRFYPYFQKPMIESIALPVEAMSTLQDFLAESNPDFLELMRTHENDIVFYDEKEAGISGVTGVIIAFQIEPGVGEIVVLVPNEAAGFGLGSALLNSFLQHFSTTDFDVIHWDIIDKEDNWELFELAREYGFQETEYVDGYRKFIFTPDHCIVSECFTKDDFSSKEICRFRREEMFSSYLISDILKTPGFDEEWHPTLNEAIQNYPTKENGMYYVWVKIREVPYVLGTTILLETDWRFREWRSLRTFDATEMGQMVDMSKKPIDPSGDSVQIIETILTQPIRYLAVMEDCFGHRQLNGSNTVPLMEYSGQPRHLYMISDKSDLDGKTITPGINKDEQRRLCFYRSIDNALLDAQEDIREKEFFVYTPHPSVKLDIYRPTVVEVPQVVQTGEMWLTKPTKVSLVGAIRIVGKRNTPPRSYLRGNVVCSLYEWEWSWIEQVTEGIGFRIGKYQVDINLNNQLPRKYYDLVEEVSAWEYGYVYKGKRYKGMNTNEDINRYRVMSPREVEKYHIGTCFDLTLYMANKLKDFDEIKSGLYVLHCYYIDATVGKDTPCHTFPVIEEKPSGKFHVLEAAWKRMAGIHSYKNMDKMTQKYIFRWLNDNGVQITDKKRCYEFVPIEKLAGLNCFEFMYICGRYDKMPINESVDLSHQSLVMEASGDEDGDAPDATDYTDEKNGLSSSEEAQEEESSEDTAQDDDSTTEEDGADNNSETMEEGPEETDYTENTDMEESESDAEEDTSDSTDVSSGDSGTANTNTLVKNYSLIKDFEKIYSLIDDISKTIDATLKASSLENQVLAQVSRNLSDTKNFITSFLQFHFKSNDFEFNLYHYTIVVLILKSNLKMLEKLPMLTGKKKD